MEFPVPGPVPFESAMLKVDRAKRHVNDLQARLTAFLQSDFYRLRVDKDTESGGYVVMYNTNPLPSDCALILGDAIHNLATPFDHIASELAVRIGLSGNKRRVQFPKHRGRDDVENVELFREIVGAFPKLASVILDFVKPYQTCDLNCWALLELDNMDKHRLLIPIVTLSALHGATVADGDGNAIEDMRLTVAAGGRLHVGGFSGPCQITDYGQPAFEITFPEGPYFGKQPVLPTLIQLTEFVENAVTLMRAAVAHG